MDTNHKIEIKTQRKVKRPDLAERNKQNSGEKQIYYSDRDFYSIRVWEHELSI
jgi:hypothetical protein